MRKCLRTNIRKTVNRRDFRTSHRVSNFDSQAVTSKEKILRFRTVLGTPMLRATGHTINIRVGGLDHPDGGWSASIMNSDTCDSFIRTIKLY